MMAGGLAWEVAAHSAVSCATSAAEAESLAVAVALFVHLHFCRLFYIARGHVGIDRLITSPAVGF